MPKCWRYGYLTSSVLPVYWLYGNRINNGKPIFRPYGARRGLTCSSLDSYVKQCYLHKCCRDSLGKRCPPLLVFVVVMMFAVGCFSIFSRSNAVDQLLLRHVSLDLQDDNVKEYFIINNLRMKPESIHLAKVGL